MVYAWGSSAPVVLSTRFKIAFSLLSTSREVQCSFEPSTSRRANFAPHIRHLWIRWVYHILSRYNCESALRNILKAITVYLLYRRRRNNTTDTRTVGIRYYFDYWNISSGYQYLYHNLYRSNYIFFYLCISTYTKTLNICIVSETLYPACKNGHALFTSSPATIMAHSI